MNMKALLLLLHRDLRDNCLIISGQMRHFAADFTVFFFVLHYSSLTSRSEIRATGRENEQNSAKLSRQGKKERKGKEREGSRREGRDDWSRSVIRRLRGSPSVDA